jgi:hypothetical protein
MSAPSVVAFIGVRIKIEAESPDIQLLEKRRHPLQLAARKESLDFYWGNFNEPEELYLALIGIKIGILGVENQASVELESESITQGLATCAARLPRLGLSEVPKLLIYFMPDV